MGGADPLSTRPVPFPLASATCSWRGKPKVLHQIHHYLCSILILAAGAAAVALAQSADKPAAGEIAAVKVNGTVKAVDKQKRTVTLVGPQGRTLTLAVRDPQKLDAVKVGDPVVATCYEALVIEVRPAGAAKPGVSVMDTMVTTKPGEIPAGAIESQVTVKVTPGPSRGHTT